MYHGLLSEIRTTIRTYRVAIIIKLGKVASYKPYINTIPPGILMFNTNEALKLEIFTEL